MKHSCLPLGGTAAAREPLAQGHVPPLRQPTSTCTFEKMGLSVSWATVPVAGGFPGRVLGQGLKTPDSVPVLSGISPWDCGFPPFLHLQNKELS